MKEREIWKTIPGFSNYEASNLGRIRSLFRGEPYIMTPAPRNRKLSYLAVYLKSDSGVYACKFVHQLVMLAFVGPYPSEGMMICHGDGDPTNNRFDNLRYDTPSENAFDREKHKAQRPPKIRAELTAGQVGPVRVWYQDVLMKKDRILELVIELEFVKWVDSSLVVKYPHTFPAKLGQDWVMVKKLVNCLIQEKRLWIEGYTPEWVDSSGFEAELKRLRKLGYIPNN